MAAKAICNISESKRPSNYDIQIQIVKIQITWSAHKTTVNERIDKYFLSH